MMSYPIALQRRMVRALAERDGIRLDFHHVQQVMEIAAPPPTREQKLIELPGGFEACVRERELSLRRRCPSNARDSVRPGSEQADYELPLPIPGEVELQSGRVTIRARMAKASTGDVLRQPLVQQLRIRNWRAGDRYQPAHTGSPKKLKELLQSKSVPAELRARWPVVVARLNGNDQIVWVPGFALADEFRETRADIAGLLLEHRVQG